MSDKHRADAEIGQALRQMEQAASNVALRLASSVKVRKNYLFRIKEMSDALLAAYKNGRSQPRGLN